MAESNKLETPKVEVQPYSTLAQFVAQLYFLSRVEAIGLQQVASFIYKNCEWKVSDDNKIIYVSCSPDMAEKMTVQDVTRRIWVADAYKRLKASVEVVDGQRAVVEKLNPDEDPERYRVAVSELELLERQLGDYKPYLTQYETQINTAESNIKKLNKELKDVPIIRPLIKWEFEISKVKEEIVK
jgi:hypothetical protein